MDDRHHIGKEAGKGIAGSGLGEGDWGFPGEELEESAAAVPARALWKDWLGERACGGSAGLS